MIRVINICKELCFVKLLDIFFLYYLFFEKKYKVCVYRLD